MTKPSNSGASMAGNNEPFKDIMIQSIELVSALMVRQSLLLVRITPSNFGASMAENCKPFMGIAIRFIASVSALMEKL
jgi:hypothetical protein